MGAALACEKIFKKKKNGELVSSTFEQLFMPKGKDDIAISTISDVHLFHARTPTERILKTLDRFYPDSEITGELDYIFIAGDLFDRIRSLADNEVYEVISFFTYWLEMLNRRGVRLRVLEGTPSHDRSQGRLIVKVNDSLGEDGCDLRYIDTLKIDYEEEFDFHVLYVPDEWRAQCDTTWDEVCELLRQQQLDSVDISIMHGMFEHQLPNGIMRDHHKASRYESITNWFISIGHIHTHSRRGKIHAQGSPDRLSHNEEEHKGIYKYIVKDNGKNNEYVSKFIVNDNATPYLTLDLVGLELESAVDYIKNVIDPIDYGYVRLLVDQKQFANGILDSAAELAKDKTIFWSKKVDSKKKKDSGEVDRSFKLELPPINPNTVYDLCRDFASSEGYSPGNITRALNLLGDFK